MNRLRYVLAYDVTSNRNRVRVARVLLDYGERVQMSVYEADLTPRELESILRRIEHLIDATDTFKAWPLRPDGHREVIELGRMGPIRHPDMLLL